MQWRKMTPEERYWCRVEKRGEDECWPWLPTKESGAYGNLQVDGKTVQAHRFGFTLAKGEIPAGHDVCHTCDWPPCQNPGHLFDGTHQENMLDKLAKGRGNFHTGSWPDDHVPHRVKVRCTECGASYPAGKRCKRCLYQLREHVAASVAAWA